MPPLNRFPSSSSPRGSSKQVASELVLSSPMPRPEFLLSRVSIRRFSSRRIRPSIASVADLFVGSLVLAGYCHEHSPRCRSLPAMPSRQPGHQLRAYSRDGFTDSDHHSSPKPWPDSGQWPRPHPTQHRSQLDTVTAQTGTGQKIDLDFRRRLKKTDGNDAETVAERKSLITTWHQYFDPKTHNHTSHRDNQLSVLPDEPQNELEEALSYDEKRYLSTASLYRKILGDEYDWKEALKLVLPHPHPRRNRITGHLYETDSPSVAELIRAVHSKPPLSSQYLFTLYRRIPTPGVEKLPSTTRGALLRQMANPPNRRPVDIRRYLALFDDMLASNIPMSRSLWTTAISFASRHSGQGRTRKRNVVRAIGIWQQMEHYAQIESDEVIFNILYDAAIKAGQFSIAERLEAEMIKRELTKRGDVEGITKTFDNFTQSGNIVDTVILNGLLSAFLKAGDFETAEGIYERMLLARNTTENAAPKTDVTGDSLTTRFEIYRSTTKRLGRLLKLSDALKEPLPGPYRAFQDSMPLTPDTRTFHILLRHYAIKTGRFDKALHIIRDMENFFEVPPRHMIYSTLFEGFSIHGNTKKETWTPKRLWALWHSYVWALIDSRNATTRFPGRFLGFKGAEKAYRPKWVNPFAEELDVIDAEGKDADELSKMSQSVPKPTIKLHGADKHDDELYMSLPSLGPKPDASTDETPPPEMPLIETPPNSDHRHHEPTGEDQGVIIREELTAEESERSEYLLNSKYTERDLLDPELEYTSQMGNRLENGVFVGRTTILHVLRAFGTCTNSEDVIEAWEQMQQLWDPLHRKATDVAIIRDELERQLQKLHL
ncbi:hypothetical protein N7450_008029 [Penicillium hetheringtonii]|uniref:Pentatricopeptide repeat protein n=1 Tax=Penicillium hetheringtonii TaxID=911720 RepID=A0AAD6DFK9_9EURO|nr:hypothetical protein N7450_008029 [Penicillium hetheringtonii]